MATPAAPRRTGYIGYRLRCRTRSLLCLVTATAVPYSNGAPCCRPLMAWRPKRFKVCSHPQRIPAGKYINGLNTRKRHWWRARCSGAPFISRQSPRDLQNCIHRWMTPTKAHAMNSDLPYPVCSRGDCLRKTLSMYLPLRCGLLAIVRIAHRFSKPRCESSAVTAK